MPAKQAENAEEAEVGRIDERGNIIERILLDAKDNPCNSRLGFARLRMRDNERGNVIKHSSYDTEGKV